MLDGGSCFETALSAGCSARHQFCHFLARNFRKICNFEHHLFFVTVKFIVTQGQLPEMGNHGAAIFNAEEVRQSFGDFGKGVIKVGLPFGKRKAFKGHGSVHVEAAFQHYLQALQLNISDALVGGNNGCEHNTHEKLALHRCQPGKTAGFRQYQEDFIKMGYRRTSIFIGHRLVKNNHGNLAELSVALNYRNTTKAEALIANQTGPIILICWHHSERRAPAGVSKIIACLLKLARFIRGFNVNFRRCGQVFLGIPS